MCSLCLGLYSAASMFLYFFTVNHLFQLKVNSKTPLTLLSWQPLADCWPSCSNHVLSEVAQSVASKHAAKSFFFPLCFAVWGLVVCCCHSLVFATHCYTNWHAMVRLPRWLMLGWCKVNVPIHDHLSKWCAAIVLHIPWCFIGSERGIFQSMKWGCNLKRKALLSLRWIFLLCIVGHVHLGFCAAMAQIFHPKICTF